MKSNAQNPLLLQMMIFIFKNHIAWHISLLFLSFASVLVIWFNYGQMFDSVSVEQLWQARHAPQTLYQWILHPFTLTGGDIGAVIFAAIISMLTFWMFDRISKLVGIGKKTFFTLFLLLNFSPELNQVRVATDPYLLAVLLWLVASWWFIRWYLVNIYRAFVGWAAIMWLSMLFSSTSAYWALGFPLCFIFWPGNTKAWWQSLIERSKFLIAYYLLIVVIVLLVPSWRHASISFYNQASEQFHHVTLEISLFINDGGNVSLATGDAFFISLALVALNALKIAGVPVIIVLWLAIFRHTSSVLTGRVKLFFAFMLGFAWILQALSLLYYGHLQNSRHYLLIIALLLWVASNGAYYCMQRITNGHLKPQIILVFAWFLVAYALSSMLKFGPSVYFEREAGQWLAKQEVSGLVMSNSPRALYYAGVSPLSTDLNLRPYKKNMLPKDENLQDRYILVQSLKASIADKLVNWKIVKTFSNERNNAAYILAPIDHLAP